MAKIETWCNQDLQQAVKVRYIDGNVFSADNNGNIIGVNVFDNGEPATLSGSVSASIIRSDGATVAAVGTLSGNKVSVSLPQSAYAVPGVISVVIKLTSGSDITTLCAVVGNVYMSTTDSVVDPGTIIPSVENLIAAIETAVASIPADYSSLWTALAPAFSSSTNYASGLYVTYNGGLYRFIKQHTGSWDSADVESVSIGNVFPPMDSKIDGGYDQTPKRLALMNYTLSDGVIQTTTGTINTSNVVYKHISCSCTAGKAYYVGGYNFGGTYCTANFLDSSGNIIGHSLRSNSTFNHRTVVVAPENAVTLIVNCRVDSNAHPMFIYGFDEQMTFTQEIGTDIKDAGGAITFGYAWDITTNAAVAQPSGTYLYKEITISGGERFVVDAYNAGENFPSVIFFNADGDIIFSMYESQKIFYGLAITAPSAAKKMLVHGREDRNLIPNVRKVISKKSNVYNELFKDSPESIAELVSIFPTYNYSNVVKTRTVGDSDTNTVYLYCSATVTPGTDYFITGWHYSDNYPLYIFVDTNGKPCGLPQIGSLTGNAQQWRVKAQAPLDAVSVFVNARKGGTNGGQSDIQVLGTQTIRDTLKKANVCDMYNVHSPVADLTSTTAKSDYYLSRFSYAYAVMLHRIMTTYPNALVICCSCNECERTTSQGLGMPEMNKVGETIADYNAVIELICKAFGAVFVDHHSCGITYYNISDYLQDYDPETGYGVHPNAAGMALIGAKTIKDLTGFDFTGKKLSVFGDSISTYNGTGSEHNQYPNGDVNNVNKMWWHISMIQHFGMTLLNNGSAGSRSVSTIRQGITGYPKSGVNQDSIDNLASGGVSPDVIIVKQGINDFGNAGSVNNADLNGHYWFGGI